ncbi:hypothetical protein A5653_16280 [Mycobacterium colombiense]|nr:hypothetical protein A5653_16280 [Mycobacterium colombiense]
MASQNSCSRTTGIVGLQPDAGERSAARFASWESDPDGDIQVGRLCMSPAVKDLSARVQTV